MAEIKSYPNNVDEEIGAENVMRWHHGRTSGVYGASGELAVAALSTPDMAVTVSDGNGWLSDENGNGIHFWNDTFLNTAALLQMAIDTADSVLDRIDRVIVEWSIPNYTQKPEIKILKGTTAVTPTAPALTNDASTRQISLARITVAAGTLAITSAMITDERFDASVCGVVTETVEVDTSVALTQFNEVLGDAQQLVDDLTNEAVPDHASSHLDGAADALRLAFEDVAVTIDNWSTYTVNGDEEAGIQAAGYTHKKAVALSGVTSSMDVSVNPSVDADSCGVTLWRENQSYDGGIYLYATGVPTSAFTLRTIKAWKVAS